MLPRIIDSSASRKLKWFGAQEAIIKEYLLSPIHVHDNVYIPCLLYYPET
jgi:hypothetical protein